MAKDECERQQLIENLYESRGAGRGFRVSSLAHFKDLGDARTATMSVELARRVAAFGAGSPEAEAYEQLVDAQRDQVAETERALQIAETAIVEPTPGDGFILHGRVTDGRQNGLRRLTVSAIDAEGQVRSYACTDDRGYFQLEIEPFSMPAHGGVVPGRVSLQVSDSEQAVLYRGEEALEALPGTVVFRLIVLDEPAGETCTPPPGYEGPLPPVCPPGLDLRAGEIAMAPDPATTADPIRFSSVVKNVGGEDTGSFKVSWQIDDGEPAIETVEPLAVGEERVSNHDAGQLSAWDHVVRFVIDPDGELDLADRDGALAERSFQVGFVGEHIVARDLAWVPARPMVGEPISFTGVLSNEGGSGPGGFRVQLKIDDVPCDQEFVPDLAPGASLELTFELTKPLDAGRHEVCLVAKGAHGTDPGFEDGTVCRDDLVVRPAPQVQVDLRVGPINLVPIAPRNIDSFVLQTDVKNHGSIPSLGFGWTWKIDGKVLEEGRNESLPPGRNEPFRLPSKPLPEGAHEATFAIDHPDLAHPRAANASRSFNIAGDRKKSDLRSLAELPGVGKLRVEKLATIGIATAEDLAASTPAAVAKAPGIGTTLARRLIGVAKRSLKSGGTGSGDS